MAKPILGYWDLRGLGEPARLMLEYCGVDYEDKRYVFGRAPDFDLSDWLNKKFSLELDFPNLPYYIDGDVKITENMAVLKYIARKYSLMPVSEAEMIKCDMLEGVVTELRTHFWKMVYLPDFETKNKFFKQTFPDKMELVDKYLASNKWLSGNRLTYPDFIYWEILSQMQLMEPNCIDKYKNVVTYYDNFFKMEKIAAYRRSNRFKKLPIVGRRALWEGNDEENTEK